MRILLAAPLVRPGDLQGNLAAVARLLARHTVSQPQLCVLPEASLLGGFWPPGEAAWLSHAELIPGGPACQGLTALARRFQTHILGGVLEREEGRYYVTHCVFGPHGLVGKQRKLFPANPTRPSFLLPGQGVAAVDLAEQRLAILACSDWLLPEPTLLAGRLRPSLLLCPTDCFHLTNESLALAKLSARAADTGAHAVAVFGRDPAVQQAALNVVVCSPRGEVLCYEQGQSDMPFELVVDLPLAPPQEVWGGFTERWRRLITSQSSVTAGC